MKKIIVWTILLFALHFPVFAQETNLVSKDITPQVDYGIGYENMVVDKRGNLYVIKRTEHRKKYFLFKYDGKTWVDISIHPSGWSGVYSLESDWQGNLYLWGTRTDQEKHGIYRRENEKWDSIPNVAAESKMRGIYLSPRNEVMAFGVFENASGKFNIARWQDHKWQPVASEIKNKVLKKQFEDGITQIGCDDKGNIFVYKFRYGPPHSNYFAKWDGEKWNLIDDSKFSLFRIRQMRVVDGVMYVAGSLKDDNKSYCIAKWDGQWSVAQLVDEKTETMTMDEKGNIYVAGNIRRGGNYAVLKFDDRNTTTYGYADSYFDQVLYVGNSIYGTVGSGVGIYSIAEGGGDVKKYVAPPNIVSKPVEPAVPKKDEKATEVWNIYKSFLETSPALLTQSFQSLNSFFAKDENGKFINEGAWKSITNRLKGETSTRIEYFSDYLKQLKKLNLKKGDNELADDFSEYLFSLSGFFGQAVEFMDLAKYGIVTPEVNRSYDEYIKSKNKFEKKEDEVNETVKKYKKRNAL